MSDDAILITRIFDAPRARAAFDALAALVA
jgi:hypothetical protein